MRWLAQQVETTGRRYDLIRHFTLPTSLALARASERAPERLSPRMQRRALSVAAYLLAKAMEEQRGGERVREIAVACITGSR